jgi:hypothetical protein
MRWWCYIFAIYFGCASEWELSRWDGEAIPTTPRHEAFPTKFNTSAIYAKARRQITFQTGWKSPHCTKSVSISRPFAQATNCTSPEITAGFQLLRTKPRHLQRGLPKVGCCADPPL